MRISLYRRDWRGRCEILLYQLGVQRVLVAKAAAEVPQMCQHTQAGPQSAFPEAGQGQAGQAQPLDTGQEASVAPGPGRNLSSPLRLDRLAMFHDIVTSPEVVLDQFLCALML